jgi:galactokinase
MDALQGDDRASSSRKQRNMQHDIISNEIWMRLADLADHINKNYDQSEAEIIETIITRLGKLLMMSSHRMGHDFDVHSSETTQLVEHLKEVLVLAERAFRANPNDGKLAEIVEALNEQLAQLT